MDMVALLSKIATSRAVSDAAKVTWLEFVRRDLAHRPPPTYTELCHVRGVFRSTIQLHVGELEKARWLLSYRKPGNQKCYIICYDALLEEAPKAPRIVTLKTKGVFQPHEAYKYFRMLYYRASGKLLPQSKQDYYALKRLWSSYTSAQIVKAMDTFAAQHRRRHWGNFALPVFIEHIDDALRLTG